MAQSRLKRFLLLFPLFLAGVLLLALAGLFTCYPEVEPADDRSVPTDAQTIARGAYLANAVATCTNCHSERDWSRLGGPSKAGTVGAGGERFDRARGLPGVFHAPNLTPTGLSEWSDGDIARAITSGVDKEGEALLPLMPYLSYSGLCADDTNAIIAYLRSLAPLPGVHPEHELDFPLPLLIRTFPQSGEAPPCLLEQDPIAIRGGYLVRAAGCGNCHTPMDKGRPVLDKSFAGGSEFIVPNSAEGIASAKAHASNITFDLRTGIGEMSEAQFVERFTRYRDPAELELEDPQRNTTMPWANYAQLRDEDLKAIYAFLKAQPPVSNKVRGQLQSRRREAERTGAPLPKAQ